jgi:acetoin:2,6-dichlorophenolindophenol oxidoreductase subunit alpha
VCENNQYGMSFSVKKAMKIAKISDRAAAYGMPGVTVDGNDVFAVFNAVAEAVDRARAGEGPSLVENVTYRWRGHSKSDANVYRTKEEIEEWKKKDPIVRLAEQMQGEGLLSITQHEEIKSRAYKTIHDCAVFAEGCADPTLESIEEGVYAE